MHPDQQVRTSPWWGRRGRPLTVPAPTTVPARADVVVVGAGLTGLATADLLAAAGREVVVLEARRAGAGTTGHSTAKVSLLQGSLLQRLAAHRSEEAVAAYVRANAAGQEWLLDALRRRGRSLEVRRAVTYAVTSAGADRVTAESEAALRAGLSVSSDIDVGLPFPVLAAVTLEGQAQIDPLDAVEALHADVEEAGGQVVEGARVTGASWGRDPWVVHTEQGDVRAGHLVLATGTPILDRTLHFATAEPNRSYAIAYESDPDVIDGMYLSADEPARSLRTGGPTAPGLLLVGGNNHIVGRARERARVDDLDAWARAHFDVGEPVWSWSAQDYALAGQSPSVGAVSGTDGRLLYATGYNKWGMASAVAAAHVLSGQICGEEPEWHTAFERGAPSVRDIGSTVRFAAGVAGHLVGDRARRLLPDTSETLEEGEGRVLGPPHSPTAVSTVEGVTRRVSATCPHLGGVLAWNDAELSWDCPLHGSRFTAGGEVIEGPATCGLKAAD